MVKQISLRQLQKAVAREKKKVKTAEERRMLERQLKEFRSGKSTKLLKRLGRGFVILAGKGARATGRGIVKARKFAEESGAGEGLKDIQFASALPIKKERDVRRGKVVRRRVRVKPRVRRITTTIVTTRRVRKKPKGKKVVRRDPANNGGFFGDLSNVGF